MGRFLAAVASAGTPLLLLEDHLYCGRLLAGGIPPWAEAAALVAHRRKAISLLRPDAAMVPVADIADAWVAANPGLKAAVSGARRTVGPLRALLADGGLSRHLVTIAQGLASALPALPLILVLPSPRDWIMAAASGREIEDDDIDAASVYMAEFLRSFSEARVDAILIDERSGAIAPDLATPVANVAIHYGWDLGVLREAEAAAPRPAGAFVVAPGAPSRAGDGVVLPPLFWSGEAPVAPEGGFRYAVVPPDAMPELVLERLAGARR